MPIAPAPYKLKCPKCGYTKVVRIKSDALSPIDIMAMSTTCPKCGEEMERVGMGMWDMVTSMFGSPKKF